MTRKLKMKEKTVSQINSVHFVHAKNAAYNLIDNKAKRIIKKIGFRAWLGTLPKPALERIRRDLSWCIDSAAHMQRFNKE